MCLSLYGKNSLAVNLFYYQTGPSSCYFQESNYLLEIQ